MKKFLISAVILISSPVFASCPVDGTETACSIAQIREPMMPTYQTDSMINEFADSPEARLAPANNNAVESQLRDFRPQNKDYSYNSSCQFGMCLQDRSDTLFQNRN